MKRRTKFAREVDVSVFSRIEKVIEAGRKVKTERSKASLPPENRKKRE